MEPNFETETAEAESALKQRLGQLGRSLKKVDLRKPIVMYPFAAVGIAAAAGAIVGFVRPKPEPGRISSAVISTMGLIAFKLIRDTAVRELGQYARNYWADQRDLETAPTGESAEGGNVRYTSPL